jgi:pseudaminic acid cytidylyltransferase
MKLALIPARGGSKRIPRKNIRAFGGKPILQWSVDAAFAAGVFDRVVVSTDDAEIAAVARAAGAETPFTRPDAIADDYSSTAQVVAHAILWLQATGERADAACCIYPTAPFLEPADLVRGADILSGSGAAFALAVTEFEASVQRALRLGGDGRLALLFPEHAGTRSQDLEPAYRDAGQFCWGRAEAWLDKRGPFGQSVAAVLLPRHRVQDIDSEDDWRRAELMFAARALGDGEPR